MSPLLLIIIGTFAVVLLIVLGLYWAFIIRPESQDAASLKKRLKLDRDPTLATAGAGRLERKQRDTEASGIEKQSDLKMTVGSFFATSAFIAGMAYFLVWLATRMHLLALVVAVLASTAPYFYVRHKRNQRIWKFEEQFPEAIDLIARALRAGHAFTTSLAMVADEVPAPVGSEFRLLYDRQNYGMPLTEAMKDFADRVPLLDARFFVTAVLMQRETGGNLAEVLDNLAAVIRDRFQVKRQVRVLTAHGRITGWILAGLPPALALALFIMTPSHLQMLIEDPLGVQMIIGAVVLQIVGTLTIRKLVQVPY
jgi:tight adherence protein B